ncbi:FAD:protein FMN transferase [Methylobacterium soli]|uniref:FAD:protein FMN transferase n=1 Tax=Methylobacterium soli TaxID=553447 RepID=A0A6L3SXA4_9HYPH|nr:FAD:protein FMN transferase [Methylobacterium soli]KAB1078548.1 FAD:protein FMN transferase [Methylobacterium soli]GJE44378.1 FAD:protein FMN transferase [Methylobacterium soli]
MRRALIPATLAPIGRDGATSGSIVNLAGRIMGTTWSVRFVSPTGSGVGELRGHIQIELARLVAQLSHWEPDSALCRFNRVPPGTRQVLPDDLFAVLLQACDVAACSDGAFDPTLGPLVDLWGFGPPGAVADPPVPEAVAAARERVGWTRLALDRESRSAHQPGGLQLDLSAIAKGYAVDRISDLLAARGITNHLVEIGGELRGRGVKPDRTPWWVALEALPGAGGSLDEIVVALHELSAATSGDYRRVLDAGGRRYGHSLDPRTGYPIDNGLIQVTVLHPSCMLADAAATALMALGPEPALEAATRHGLATRLVVTEGSGVSEQFSPAARRMLS